MSRPDSPFEWPGPLRGLAQALQPPPWVVQEMQHRLVLVLNHMLGQRAELRERMRVHTGRLVRLQWQGFWLQLRVTPAGMFELAPEAEADLQLTFRGLFSLDTLRTLARGQRPMPRSDGDTALAADMQWLLRELNWDMPADLARLLDQAPLQAAMRMGRDALDGLRGWMQGAGSDTTGDDDNGSNHDTGRS